MTAGATAGLRRVSPWIRARSSRGDTDQLRKGPTVKPRKMATAVALCSETPVSLSQAGRLLGGKSRTMSVAIESQFSPLSARVQTLTTGSRRVRELDHSSVDFIEVLPCIACQIRCGKGHKNRAR